MSENIVIAKWKRWKRAITSARDVVAIRYIRVTAFIAGIEVCIAFAHDHVP